jgi:hypothetical protein
MAKAKKKLLPKDFDALLKKGDLTELKSVFDTCLIDARGGYAKQTALAFDACPDELARWLVTAGADLSATDTWGNTPLHSRARSAHSRIDVLLELGADVHDNRASIGTPLHSAARSHNDVNALALIRYGANVEAQDKEGLTPLELALQTCSNIDIERMVPLAECLIEAGSRKTERMTAFVEEIGKTFEFHRTNFNAESVDAVSCALNKLYEIFGVAQVAPRRLHDGRSPIVAFSRTWHEQHEELWNLLVPSTGAASTAQGEVIRITGRISNELEGNGGANWDADFRLMVDALLNYFHTGNPLAVQILNEAKKIAADVKNRTGDTTRLAQIAVYWVLLNPTPIELQQPEYKR